MAIFQLYQRYKSSGLILLTNKMEEFNLNFLQIFVKTSITQIFEKILPNHQIFSFQGIKMILKLINQTTLKKDDHKKFIPFVNERNHMGAIIRQKKKDKNYFRSIEVFQNLKKTTKQYFFHKKYQKMVDKLQRCKVLLESEEPNYDKKVAECIKKIEKDPFFYQKFNPSSQNREMNNFYVDLSLELDQNIAVLKQRITRKKYSGFKNRNNAKIKIIQNSQNNLKVSDQQINQFSTQKQQSTIKDNQQKYQKQPKNSYSQQCHKQSKRTALINCQLFQQLTPQSEKMANFTNCGLKYKHLVKNQKKNHGKSGTSILVCKYFQGRE